MPPASRSRGQTGHGDTISLLRRLSPPLLLTRFSPSRSSHKPSLEERLSSQTDPLELEFEEGMVTPAEEIAVTDDQEEGQVAEATNGASRRSLSDRLASPSPRPSTEDQIATDDAACLSHSHINDVSPPNRANGRSGLARQSSSPTGRLTDNEQSATSISALISADQAAAMLSAVLPPAQNQRPTADPDAAQLEQHRAVLLPLLMENVRRRYPDADEDTVARHARMQLTDEQCKEFVALAHQTREQLREKAQPALDGQAGEKKKGVDGESTVGTPSKKMRLEQDGIGLSSSEADRGAADPATKFLQETIAQVAATSRNSELRTSDDVVARESTLDSAPMSMSPSVSSIVTPTEPPPYAVGLGIIAQSQLQSEPSGLRTTDVVQEVEMKELDAPSSSNISPSDSPVACQTEYTATDPAGVHDGSSDEDAVSESHSLKHVNPVPGMWSFRVGNPSASVLEYEFYVEEAVAASISRWARRNDVFNLDDTHVSIHLLCLPTRAVEEVNDKFASTTTPEDVTQAICSIPTEWPRLGKLVVKMNPDTPEGGRTWFPVDLSSSSGSLDVTAAVKPGANRVRLLQLCAMDDRAFVVYASSPAEDERQRFSTMHAQQRTWQSYTTSGASGLLVSRSEQMHTGTPSEIIAR